MDELLVPRFEDILESFLCDSDKDRSYYRINSKDPKRLYNDLNKFLLSGNSSIYKDAVWFKQEATLDPITTIDFFASLVYDWDNKQNFSCGETIVYDADDSVNSKYHNFSINDEELIADTFSKYITNDRQLRLIVSSIIGEYLSFKVIGKTRNRVSSVSEKYYHFSRFKKLNFIQKTGKGKKVMADQILETIDDSKLNLNHKFVTAKQPIKVFSQHQHIYNMKTLIKYEVKSIYGGTTLNDSILVKRVDSTNILDEVVHKSLFNNYILRDHDNVPLLLGDYVRVTAGEMDNFTKEMGWPRPHEPEGFIKRLSRQDNRDYYMLYRLILGKIEYVVVDMNMNKVYLQPVDMFKYKNVVKNAKLAGLLIAVDPHHIELAPSNIGYEARTGKKNGLIITNAATIVNEEEVKEKKRLRLLEEEQRRKDILFDKEHGPYDVSEYLDKIVWVDAPDTNDVLHPLNNDVGRVSSIDNELGRVTIHFPYKKDDLVFRKSVGHLNSLKIRSGLVVSSEETPELV